MMRVLLGIGLTILVLSATNSANAALVAHWKLGEGTSSTTPQTVSDSSVNGLDGVLGTTTSVQTLDPDWRTTGLGTGKLDPVATLGSVLSFNAPEDDRATFSSHASTFQALTEGTISLWARIDSADFNRGPQVFFGASDSGDGSSELRFFFNEGSGAGSPHDIRFGIRNDGSSLTAVDTSNNIVTADEWYHVAVTVDSISGTSLYVDGVLSATNASTAFLADVAGIDSVLLGGNIDSGGFQWEFDGKMSDVQIYDSALDADVIALLADPANLGTAFLVPEPSTVFLALVGFTGLLMRRTRSRRRC